LKMTAILIASRNAHKVSEIRAVLGSPFQFLTLNDFPAAPKTVEDADTFAGNAAKKAVELSNWLSYSPQASFITQRGFVLADDSGLEMDALQGAPGVLSARFAAAGSAHNSSDAENNSKLLRLLDKIPAGKRAARFRCVLALTPVLPPKIECASPVCYADELQLETRLFEGVCEGKIIQEARGRQGFGYDPLFVPEGFEKTFAELGDKVKNTMSHRAKALAKLKEFLKAGK
jgi:XTP/dITP diphosphohydrolase